MAAASSKDKGGDLVEKAAVQSEEDRKAALAQAPSGAGTATGQAKGKEAEDERLEGAERGAPTEPTNAPPSGDYAGGETQEPVGLQAEPAIFTPTGTLTPGLVASPSGPVPASTVDNPEEALKNAAKGPRGALPNERTALTEEQVATMSGPELRAVAEQRGYKVNEFGTRTIRQQFLQRQGEDKTLVRETAAR